MKGHHPDGYGVTVAEAKAMPAFFTVSKISKFVAGCDDCRAHAAEAWVNGSACDVHKTDYVTGKGKPEDGSLAVAVFRAGGNPEPAFAAGTVAAAQWSYKRKGAKAVWSETVHALTRDTYEPAALAA